MQRQGLGGVSRVPQRGLMWSVEKEKGHKYKRADEIVNAVEIEAALEKGKEMAKDKAQILSILESAKERSFLSQHTQAPKSEYVQVSAFFAAHFLLVQGIQESDIRMNGQAPNKWHRREGRLLACEQIQHEETGTGKGMSGSLLNVFDNGMRAPFCDPCVAIVLRV